MSTIFAYPHYSRCAWLASLSIALLFNGTGAISAQTTPVYTFEPDLQGFAGNGGGVTVSLETSGQGATSSPNSMKLDYADFSSFAGGATNSLNPAFNDPLGLDFVQFDLTNTNRFVPPNPVVGQTPTFANMSVTFFGSLSGSPLDVQFAGTEQAVGNFEAGTHQITIDISNTGGASGTGGGENPATGEFHGYDGWVAKGWQPSGFEIYLNKNGLFGNPAFAWTVYVDTVRVGRVAQGVPGDYNGNGVVDMADYVLWRKGGPLQNEVADPGTVSQADYTQWRMLFGNTSGSGSGLGTASVPEPTGMLLLLVSAVFGFGIRKDRFKS